MSSNQDNVYPTFITNMPKTKRMGKIPIYPWLTMEVGESFAFRPNVTEGSARVLASRASTNYYPRKFRTRRLGNMSFCWRKA